MMDFSSNSDLFLYKQYHSNECININLSFVLQLKQKSSKQTNKQKYILNPINKSNDDGLLKQQWAVAMETLTYSN